MAVRWMERSCRVHANADRAFRSGICGAKVTAAVVCIRRFSAGITQAEQPRSSACRAKRALRDMRADGRSGAHGRYFLDEAGASRWAQKPLITGLLEGPLILPGGLRSRAA